MITITIPTTGRAEKLADCLKSIDHDAAVKIGAIYRADIPWDVVNSMKDVSVSFSEEDPAHVQTALAMSSREDSHILIASDDVVFLPGAIQAALDALNERFPDSCGVVGLNVTNFKASPFAFMLIGNKFFTHRMGRRIFYSEYKHFYADTELGEFAAGLGMFYLCPTAEIIHHHPVSGAPQDETHRKGRMDKWTHDYKIYEFRKRCTFGNKKHTVFPHLPVEGEAAKADQLSHQC